MMNWVHDRLEATGTTRRARARIIDASVKESELPRTKGLTGAFTTDQAQRWDRLESWARERFPMMQAVEYRWSGMVMETSTHGSGWGWLGGGGAGRAPGGGGGGYPAVGGGP